MRKARTASRTTRARSIRASQTLMPTQSRSKPRLLELRIYSLESMKSLVGLEEFKTRIHYNHRRTRQRWISHNTKEINKEIERKKPKDINVLTERFMSSLTKGLLENFSSGKVDSNIIPNIGTSIFNKTRT